MARTASHQGGRTTPREDRESMQVRRHRQKTLEAGTSSFDASSVGSLEPPSPNARGVPMSFQASFHNFVRPASRQAVAQAASCTSLKAVEPCNDFVPEDIEAIPMNDVTALFPMRFTGLIRLKGRAAPLQCYDVLAADKLLARAKRAGMTIEYGLSDAMREGRCVGRGATGATWSEDRRTPSSAERSGSIESGSQYSALASIVRRGTAAIVGEEGSSRSDGVMSSCSETASQRERYLSSGLEEARRLPAGCGEFGSPDWSAIDFPSTRRREWRSHAANFLQQSSSTAFNASSHEYRASALGFVYTGCERVQWRTFDTGPCDFSRAPK